VCGDDAALSDHLLTIITRSAAAEMGDRLATVDMGRKVVDAVPLSVGELGPI